MQLERTHFNSTLLPRQITRYIKMLEELNSELSSILAAELNAGNRIVNVTTDWPDDGSIVVSLLLPFHGKYEKEGVTFEANEDPHYWKQGYASEGPKQLVVC